MDELLKYMKALVFLQAQSLTGGTAFAKPELILSQAGLSHKEVAEVLGKSTTAVAKAVSRAKQAQKENGDGE